MFLLWSPFTYFEISLAQNILRQWTKEIQKRYINTSSTYFDLTDQHGKKISNLQKAFFFQDDRITRPYRSPSFTYFPLLIKPHNRGITCKYHQLELLRERKMQRRIQFKIGTDPMWNWKRKKCWPVRIRKLGLCPINMASYFMILKKTICIDSRHFLQNTCM